MRFSTHVGPVLGAILWVAPFPASGQAPWTEADTRRIVDNISVLRLAPDLSHLRPGERTAVAKLLEAGRIFQELYEDQNHPDAIWARSNAQPGSDAALLYRLYQGPVGTNASNQRVPFLAVRGERPGRNVYPLDLLASELEAYLSSHPSERIQLLGVRTVVRRATAENLRADLATLAGEPGLRFLHPALEPRLEALRENPSRSAFYAVPYAVAFSGRLRRVRALLVEAAEAVQGEDRDLAAYLRLRAGDMLTSSYEGGDAAWVNGQFVNLNAEIGSYETYDDALFGVKAFYALSLLARDRARSDELAAALTDIQEIENSLPYERTKSVRSQIPVGVYNVVADFGQSRGLNTATILPNDTDHARKYGRTILLRYNIMTAPELFEGARGRFCAAVAESHCAELSMEGNFQRTLWHEIGHYLGVDRTDDGRALDDALGSVSNLYEEMKADLVSLFAAERLHGAGHYNDAELRSFYAGGILRVLQLGPPRRDQPYQTMQLMQWNWFIERGVVALENGRLRIRHDRYPAAVESLLREVLAIQAAGDVPRAERFIDEWTRWDPAVHGVTAAAMRGAPAASRVWLVRYAALDE
jgi:hypothetical protein